MIREVDLVSYLPEFMQSYKEPVATLKAENPEFTIVWNGTDRTLYNHFISTADEYGICRFEKILGIYPGETDSLEIRRMRVQNRWFTTTPYTLRVLISKISELFDKAYNFSVSLDFKIAYKLALIVFSLDDSQIEELKYLLSEMIPLNITSEIIYESPHQGVVYFGGVMCEADIIEIKQRR